MTREVCQFFHIRKFQQTEPRQSVEIDRHLLVGLVRWLCYTSHAESSHHPPKQQNQYFSASDSVSPFHFLFFQLKYKSKKLVCGALSIHYVTLKSYNY